MNEPLGLELIDLRHERLGRHDVVLVAVELVQGRRGEQAGQQEQSGHVCLPPVAS